MIVLPRGKRSDIPEAVDDPAKYTIFVQDWLNENVAENQEMDMSFGFGENKCHDKPENLLINGKGYANGKVFKDGVI